MIKKIYISPIFLVLKQIKKILCIEPGHEKSPMENINDRSKFWKRIVCKCWKNTLQLLKKYFANVKQILYKCWKILCIVLDTRKAQWRNISVRSKFWQNILQMLKKYLQMLKNTLQMLEILEKYFASNLDTRKAQWRNISVRSKSRIWLQSRKQFLNRQEELRLSQFLFII